MLKAQWQSTIKSFNDHSVVPTDEWDKNTKVNLKRFHASNGIWKLHRCFVSPNDKAVVIVGASPCLKRDAEKLKDCNDDFCVCVVNAALKYVLKKGVKPSYVVALDSDTHDIYEHLDVDSKDLKLIASSTLSPKVLRHWKGEVIFMPYFGMKAELRPLVRSRLGKAIPVGGNALGTMVSMATQVFGSRIIILVASECCYDKHYYHDKTIARNNIQPTEFYVKDINGKQRITTATLHTYKLWLERYALEGHPMIKIIDTSVGILGKRDDKSYIYTYELSEIINKVKEASNKKREMINANPELLNQPLYSQDAKRGVPAEGSRADVRGMLPVCGARGTGVSEMRAASNNG